MDQVHVIRHKVLVEGRSQRRVAHEMGVSRVTVNLYGPRDNFDLETSHVIPAMIRKFIAAQQRRAVGRAVGRVTW
jgi:GDP-L-fucose synthase